MTARRGFHHALIAAVMFLVAVNVAGQTQTTTKPFEPQVGQSGKDVVWVPTPQALVDKMLDMAKLTPQDIHFDLGSGDGRTGVITAAKRGATSTGIEYNPDMVALSQQNAKKGEPSPRQGHVHEGGSLRNGLFEGNRPDTLPSPVDQHAATSSTDSRHETGYPGRVEHV